MLWKVYFNYLKYKLIISNRDYFFFLSLILHFKIADEVTKYEELIKPIISSPLLTDDIIIELKVINEKCILLTDEIQQLKHEVSELSEVKFHCSLV